MYDAPITNQGTIKSKHQSGCFKNDQTNQKTHQSRSTEYDEPTRIQCGHPDLRAPRDKLNHTL